MKTFRFACLAIATAALLPSITSCSSDSNPFDITISNKEKAKAFIKFNLTVEDTRAGEFLTEEEKVIKKVNVYVFDQNHQLETKTSVTLKEGEKSVVLEVSQGKKTLYVITAESGINPAEGISMEDFESLVFASKLGNLISESGHVMIGKSEEQQVMMSSSAEDMPASNNFNIKLVRTLAKAQVKATDLNGSSFGINLGTVSFKAQQTCDEMIVFHNGMDIFSSFTDMNEDGTYDKYSLRDTDTDDFLNAVSADFTAAGCEYLPENIIANPVSGNTTFLSIKIATTPQKYYSFAADDTAPKATAETPVAGTTYYVVGVVDREHGISDYTVDTDSKVITFNNEEDAQRYMSSLNSGKVSSITVSQTDGQLRAPATRAGESTAAQFEVFTFTNGEAYYRVNIAHTEGSGDSSTTVNKVVRNKFYKVTINSVKSLGFSAETMLRPTNPAADVDVEGGYWISASFEVADWDEVEQNVDL